jgi:hydroxypyruvate isomerase
MTKLSANLGFLWTELPLTEAIRAAANAGFDAVECHWPFETPAEIIKSTLLETNLGMLSLNTSRGNEKKGEFGICAFPDRVSEAREAIQQAVNYAVAIDAKAVHVMPGKAAGIDGAMECFLDNLGYAATLADKFGLEILIEPINREDVPGYFLADMETAVEIVRKLKRANIKIMFDCYHIQKIHGELRDRLERNLDIIGHIQIAAYPSRHEPDEGDVDYPDFLKWLDALGYAGYVGAEYKPRTTTDAGLDWIDLLRRQGE